MLSVVRWVGFVLYAFLVLALADWTGTADVRWPWEAETKTNRWDKEAVEQAKLELERIQRKAEEARRRREEEKRRLAKLKEEQALIEAKRQKEEQKLKLAVEQRSREEQKLREAEQRRKDEAQRKVREQPEADGIAPREAAERRRQEELRLASTIDTEIQDNFNRAQIQQMLEYERIGTSREWKNTFTNNTISVKITETYDSRTSPCRKFKVSLVGKHTQAERVKRACRDVNRVWRW
jgi:hypothetical protein